MVTMTGKGSIRTKLVLSFMGTIWVALLITTAAFVITEVVRARGAMVSNVSVLANVIGLNSTAALLFDDVATAEETLSALRAKEDVIAAVIYTSEGEPFASYVRVDAIRFRVPRYEASGERFGVDRLDLFRDIEVDGEKVGSVFIRSDTEALRVLIIQFAAMAAGMMALASFIAWYGAARLQRQIAAPLGALARGSEAMAEGDLSFRVEVETEDEIGTLAHAFNGMASSLRGLVTQVGDNTRAVSEATRTLRGASDEMHAEASKQEIAVEGTAESIERMSGSIDEVNASVETLAATAQETSSSALEMDNTISTIATHMDDLAETIDSVASSVVEMTSAIREIARGADTLNGATESTASSLHQLSASVEQVERNAQQSHVLSEQAMERAGRGMRSVQETVGGMRKIQESFGGLEVIISRLDEKSQSIGEVLNVIEGVVEQTNLLALNAAIISSHAGEHGRAFAVVAEEVKNLSDRTAGSTKEIGGLIAAVQAEIANAVESMTGGGARVDAGVKFSLEAGEILKAISHGAEESTVKANEIVQATGEQARGLERVEQAMLQVKQIVEQLNRGTHEQDNASAEITRGVERMRELGQNAKRSTQEQRKESRHITDAVEVVAGRINQILGATKDQTKQSEQILEALGVFREVTVESSRRAEEMKRTVELLADRSAALDEEIGRFSV
jgi:methyl-accepting chemotaxis protein